MARIGLKRPIVSEITEETNEGTTYGTGEVMAKAISANININNIGTEPLYADDEASETASGFADGTIEINIDDLSDPMYSKLCGHASVEVGGVSELWAGKNDMGPYVGLGFVMVRMKNGVRTYPARIIKKIQFSEPSEEAKTKGKEIEWQTPNMNGAILMPKDGYWKRQATFETEQDAFDWIDGILHTGSPVSKTALDAQLAAVELLEPEDYTSETWGALSIQVYLGGIVSDNPEASQAKVTSAASAIEDAIAALEAVSP